MSMETQKYNGWTNYATWCVNLWLSNDESTYFYLVQQATEIKNNPDYFKIGDQKILKNPVVRLADIIKHMIDDSNPILDQADLYNDVLRHALAFVDYQEIAKSYLEGD